MQMQGQLLKAAWPCELCDVPCQTDAVVRIAERTSIPERTRDVPTKCPLLSWWELSCNAGVIHATSVSLSTLFNAGMFPLKFQCFVCI